MTVISTSRLIECTSL